METLKEQFIKSHSIELHTTEAYIEWLETKVHKADDDKKKILFTFEKLRDITYNEDEVKTMLSESIKYGFGCIMRGANIQKLPSMLAEWFEANKKQTK